MFFASQKANLVDMQSSRFWWYSFVFERTQSRLALGQLLIKESVLRPEILQILSASQAKKHTHKKTTGQNKVGFFM